MAYENLCMYCFEDMEGQGVCPHCGRDSRAAVPQIQMLPGSLVYHDRFLIGRALGQDATGIVYAAFDTKKENRLRIREYLPRDCAERLNDGAVVPVAGMEDQFEAGIRKLRASVESVEDPRKRHFFFEENGTAYIAQRKSAAAAAADDGAEAEEERGGRGRILLFAGIAVAVLLVAAILLITLFNGAVSSRDITASPTLDPSQVWIPATTPSPTPYVAPTFAALVDPELSWMDYTYEGDVEQEYQQAERRSATATPVPVVTAAPTSSSSGSGYKLINGSSSRADITALQERLSDLGWLDESQITGKYDSATRQAVRDFQSFINDSYSPSQKLSVDGAAGPKTLQWLYETAAVKPTPSPTPRVTPKPQDTTVDETATAAEVRAMQRKLITLGLMAEGSDDGSYGATTASAVRRFQKRVNELAGYDVLAVTGKMDPQSMAFLNYYAEEWARLRQATAEPTQVPAPTAAPTPTPTTRPIETLSGVIDANAPADQIRKVQQLLADIGMLRAGGVDGVYGSGTISAVADFQQWVNAQRNEQTLAVNGEVDQLTLAYLQYCADHGLYPHGAPTAVPTAAPTAAPATMPPIEDEPAEPDENQEIAVGPDSDPDSIRYVQEMLSAVGALDGAVDGVYGRGTAQAVQRFQQWVNSIQGEGTLPVTGQVDNRTRLALEYAFDHELTLAQATAQPTAAPTELPTGIPTEAPTPAPTEAPTPTPVPVDYQPEVGEGTQEITVGADSDPDSIRYVQEMLASVGLLSPNDADGIYGNGTVQAVRSFQQWVNSIQGEGTLPVTGQVDDRTRQALEYAFDHDLRYEAPRAEEQGVGAVGDVAIEIAGSAAGDGVVSVSGDSFSVRWNAEGDIDSYFVYVQDGSGQTVVSQEGTDATAFSVNAAMMNPGEVYTLRLGVLPARGGREDVVWRTARFALAAQATPEPEPTVGAISAPAITIAGVAAGSSAITIEDDSFQISWAAKGAVDSYYVRITDADGSDITEPQRTDRTGVSLRASAMQPGVLYTLTVGAVPVNGGEEDMLVSRAQFIRPVQATPEPTQAPTPVPTEIPTPEPRVASIGKPVVNIGGSAYQKDGVAYMTDSSIIISWSADGDVESYTIYVENQSGERQELGTTTDTSRTVSTQSLPAGVYTIFVGALPENGGRDDMQWSSVRFGIPAPTAEPTAQPAEQPSSGGGTASVSGPISAASDADTVQQLQMRLYSLGLLSTDGLEPGVLDQKTLQAVAEFQARMNEQYGASLEVIDPTDPASVVDAATVRAIFAI